MPKIDSITGVPVLTQHEFWAKEAEHEGKGRSGSELMCEMYENIETEDRKQEAEVLQNPDESLKTIKNHLDGFEGEDVEDCVETYGFSSKDIVSIKMLKSEIHSGFGKSTDGFQAKLVLRDNSTRNIEYSSWYTSGSFYEPPDGEAELVVIAVNDEPVVYRYDNTCAYGSIWELEGGRRLPKCEVCDHFGGGALYGMINSAKYLAPASHDQGKTVTKWVMVCVAHIGDWYEDAGWIGPVVKLESKEPLLPCVGDTRYRPHY